MSPWSAKSEAISDSRHLGNMSRLEIIVRFVTYRYSQSLRDYSSTVTTQQIGLDELRQHHINPVWGEVQCPLASLTMPMTKHYQMSFTK